MKITALGHGGAFAGIKEGNSSFLIEHNNKKMLFDCGTLTPYILRDEMGISLNEIDAIYISHCHADHIGGLPLVLQSRYWIPILDEKGNKILPKIFCDYKVFKEMEDFLKYELTHSKDGKLFDFFDFIDGDSITFAEVFTWQDIKFKLSYYNYHVAYGFTKKPCCGLSFEYNNKKVGITADTAKVWDFEQYDLIIHDCETGNYHSGVHAHYLDIIDSCENLKNINIPIPEIYLTHFTKYPDFNIHDNRNFIYADKIRFFCKGEEILL